jgi:hypothetical protein
MMKYLSMLKWLIPPIFLLALTAALAGLWPGEGTPYSLTNFRGEQVMINARGLYYWDTVSSAAQMQANDLVTLLLGLPLLAISFWLSQRGSLRGRLLLSGTLGFILYTYITMSFGTAYNKLFLVYVALFSLSLFAFTISMMTFDLESLPAHFSEKLPRRGIAILLFFAAAFLALAWLGRIAPTVFQDQIPTLENTTSMFIQAMDLGIVVPLCCAGRHPFAAAQRLGLSAGFSWDDKIFHLGHRRQPDGLEHGASRRAGQCGGAGRFPHHGSG